MEVITIEATAFKELMSKIDFLIKYISSLENDKKGQSEEDGLADNYEICTFLKISPRTLQRLRSNKQINYTIVSGKARYNFTDLRKAIENGVIRSKYEYLENLLENHKRYVDQRRNNKPNE